MRHVTGPGGVSVKSPEPDGTLVELREPPAGEAVEARSAAEAVVHGFLAAVDAGDLPALAGLFEPDAGAYLPFADTPALIQGREAVLARFSRLIDAWCRRGKSPPFVGFEPRDLVVGPAGPGHALATFLVGIEGDTGRRSMLLRHTGGGWRILHLHASNQAPRTG